MMQYTFFTMAQTSTVSNTFQCLSVVPKSVRATCEVF